MSKSISGLLIILCSVLFSCNRSHDNKIPSDIVNNPASANGMKNTKHPEFTFDSESFDFGTILQGEKAQHLFKFKNTGNSDLLISDASASCGCTVANFPKTPIKPGQESKIDVTFDSDGKHGFYRKTVTLMANTQPNKKVLSIKVVVFTPEENK
ncbi:MAG: DUF1573 domain-containing protein [Bacteroidota bacterium]|nr:DUF1573 domain-containing protein [Bacteroidota bacterium]